VRLKCCIAVNLWRCNIIILDVEQKRTNLQALQWLMGSLYGPSQRGGRFPYIVSQFTFDGMTIGAWGKLLHSDYPGIPIRVGLASVTFLPKLIKFAMICGIGASLAALRRSNSGLINILADKDPADVIQNIETTYSSLVPHLPARSTFISCHSANGRRLLIG
jgi:hypothetical protein